MHQIDLEFSCHTLRVVDLGKASDEEEFSSGIIEIIYSILKAHGSEKGMGSSKELLEKL